MTEAGVSWAAQLLHAGRQSDEEAPVRLCQAHKDGRELITLGLIAQSDGIHIECEVYPVSSLRVEPLRPGPYVFANEAEAAGFLDEAMQALAVLGCDVA